MAMNLENLRQQTDIYDPLVQSQLIELIDKIYNGEGDGTAGLSDVISVIAEIHEKTRQKQYGLWRRSKLKAASRFEWPNPILADGVPIYARQPINKAKVNHKSHTPFDRSIINNKASFFMGKPFEVMSTVPRDQETLTRLYEDLGLKTTQIELAQAAVGQGTSFLLLYSPEGENGVRVAKKQSYHCVVLYDQDNGDAKYAMVYSPELSYGTHEQQTLTGTTFNGVWYDRENQRVFSGPLEDVRLKAEDRHLFGGVPLIEFPNNTERVSDVELTIGLQDLFDIVDSDLVSEISQFRLAYLLLKNMGLDLDQETLDKMRESGVFSADEDNASVEFIEKDLNHESIEYAKRDLRARIYEQANSYDPNTVANQSGDVTAFQIRMKLKPLEDSTKETELMFRRSFRELFRLIAGFGQAFNSSLAFDTASVDFIFHRNYPQNVMADLTQALQAGAQLSQKQILRLLPFNIDPDQNAEELAEEMPVSTVEDPPGFEVQDTDE